jgi:hypothetical protein
MVPEGYRKCVPTFYYIKLYLPNFIPIVMRENFLMHFTKTDQFFASQIFNGRFSKCTPAILRAREPLVLDDLPKHPPKAPRYIILPPPLPTKLSPFED